MNRIKIILSFLILFLSSITFAQLEGANWYFGTYAGLDFSSGNPVPVFDGQLTTSEGCSSVSDNQGNLLFYTDGRLVYDRNHNLMPNGAGLLGHPSSSMSSVICPKPGTWNPGAGRFDGYIICTIDYAAGPNGIRWSEVDLLANGGNGDIVVATKNTHLIGTTTIEAANFVVHENGCDYWLVTKEVSNSVWQVFPVTAAGVGATSVVSNMGPVTPIAFGCIKGSPNSELIGLANGAAGVHVYDFDRLTGQLTYKFGETALGTSYYSLEYSPSGRFMYYTRLSDPNIYQVDLLSANAADFVASRTVIGTTASNSHGYLLGALQLAPNGKIYLALINSGNLGVIDSPNLLGAASNYIDNIISIAGTNTNGNPTGVILGLPSFPGFLLKDEKTIAFTQVCNSLDAQFSLSDYDDLYGQEWYITPTGNAFPATPISSNQDFTTSLIPGNYDVKIMLDYNCYADSVIRTVSILPFDLLDLGNDVCFSNGLILDASNNYDFYEWQDGSTNQTFAVTVPGTYSCEVGKIGANLVYNGDFEMGNTGFTSQYDYTTGSTTEGQYFVGTSIPDVWWAGCGDHTTGSGNMMILNAACTGAPGADFWCQTIAVTPNTDYFFSSFFANANTDPTTAVIALAIDGTQVATHSSVPGACNYEELNYIWNSGTQTSVNVCLREISNSCMGADFIVDDIRFSPICYSDDEVIVNPLPTATIAGTATICQNGTAPTITFTGADATAPYTFTYTLNGGAPQTVISTGNTATVTAPTNVAGTFDYELISVMESSATACTQLQTGNAEITVLPLPTASISGAAVVCENAAEPVITFTGGNGNAPYTFTYSLNGGAAQTTVSTGNIATVNAPTTFSGTFTYQLISVEDASTLTCSQIQTGTVAIGVNPLPTATIAGNAAVCRDATEPLVTFTGANGAAPYVFTYSINAGAPQTITSTGNSATLNAPTNNTGTYTYELISVQENSSATCTQNQGGTITIDVNPIPVASFNNLGTCLNTASQFTNTSTVPAVNGATVNSWDWDFGDGNSSAVESPAHTYGAEDFYNVTLTVTSNHGCTNTTTGTGTVYPLPQVSFSPTSVCLDSNTVFTDLSTISNAQTSNSLTGWNWDFGDGNTATQQNPLHMYAGAGTYSAELEVTSNHNCVTTLSETVTVHPKPTADFSGVNLSGCSPFCAELNSSATVASPSSITNYSWTLSNGEAHQSNQTFFGSCFTNNSGQTHFIDVQLTTTTNEGCQSTFQINDMIEVYHNPIVGFNYLPDRPNVHNPVVNFLNTSQFADQYEWMIFTDTLNAVNPAYEFPAEPDHHKISLIATTDEGCSDTTYAMVEILDKIIFYVPNTFTPDGRAFNEMFTPVFTSGYDPDDYYFVIFNRWGERIFETHLPNEGWNGEDKRNGQEVSTGTYIWKIEFKETMSTQRHIHHGHVNVLR
jgi:gliding motility-associated-like protein